MLALKRESGVSIVLGVARFDNAAKPRPAPANYSSFDAVACFYTLPKASTPSTQKRNHIRADVILTKQFKGLIRRWYAFMSEGIDALLPCCHNI